MQDVIAMHARATKLAMGAMKTMAALGTPANDGMTDYERARADYERRRIEIREAGIARGKAHNQRLREEAQIRKHGGVQVELPLSAV